MVPTKEKKSEFKFSEGERVLCFEPDPHKAKVLYNSKVLGTCVREDEKGRPRVSFLIHFQGWNSTWDRFVTEDYLLKDTEENRIKQRKLAEEAHLTATQGGNLYRKGRQKRQRTTSDDRRSSDKESIDEEPDCLIPWIERAIGIDDDLITKSKKSLRLPCKPCALDILEEYLESYILKQLQLLSHKRGYLRPSVGRDAHITVEEIVSRIQFCYYVMDSFRIYIDFYVLDYLLFLCEREKFLEVTQKKTLQGRTSKDLDATIQAYLNEMEGGQDIYWPAFDYRKTSFWSFWDGPQPAVPPNSTNNCYLSLPSTSKQSPPLHFLTPISPISEPPPINNINNPPTQYQPPPSPEPCPTNCPMPIPIPIETPSEDLTIKPSQPMSLASILGHNKIKGSEQLMLRPMKAEEMESLKRMINKDLVPPWFRLQRPFKYEHYPATLVCGATHILRGLYKLPKWISTIPFAEDNKKNNVLEYLKDFAKYLQEHDDWFGEKHYH